MKEYSIEEKNFIAQNRPQVSILKGAIRGGEGLL